jgi:hypothetical protein
LSKTSGLIVVFVDGRKKWEENWNGGRDVDASLGMAGGDGEGESGEILGRSQVLMGATLFGTALAGTGKRGRKGKGCTGCSDKVHREKGE